MIPKDAITFRQAGVGYDGVADKLIIPNTSVYPSPSSMRGESDTPENKIITNLPFVFTGEVRHHLNVGFGFLVGFFELINGVKTLQERWISLDAHWVDGNRTHSKPVNEGLILKSIRSAGPLY